MTQESTPYNPQRVMLIVAHPDDGEFMAAGTLSKWAREGKEVVYVLCTSGDKGSSDPSVNPKDLAVVREREQRAAAAVVGAKDVVFLGYEDGTLRNTLELRRDIAREIRRHKPDVVVCQDPTSRFAGSYINHPDHRAAGDTALDAVYPSARDYHAFPDLIAEGHLPHNVREVYMGGFGGDGAVVIDISDTIDVKVAALMEHKSQVRADDPERANALMERIKDRARQVGEAHAVAFAETFRYIVLAR